MRSKFHVHVPQATYKWEVWFGSLAKKPPLSKQLIPSWVSMNTSTTSINVCSRWTAGSIQASPGLSPSGLKILLDDHWFTWLIRLDEAGLRVSGQKSPLRGGWSVASRGCGVAIGENDHACLCSVCQEVFYSPKTASGQEWTSDTSTNNAAKSVQVGETRKS